MADVEFSYDYFQARYPELGAWATPSQAQGFWDVATMIFSNTSCSQVKDDDQRRTLLNLLTAHLAQLSTPVAGGGTGPMVGRVSSVSEGSVSLSSDWGGAAEPGEAWYLQTKYGASFWATTRWMRLGRYYPGPQRFRQPQWPWRRMW